MEGTSLIEHLKKGDQKYLSDLYLQHREEFIVWIHKKYSVPADDAKDIYQFAIMKFYENVINGKLNSLDSSPKTYLFAIGKYKALEYNRALNKQVPTVYDMYLEEETDENHMIKESQLNAIESGLRDLGSPCEEILRLYYYQKMSMDSICEKLGYKNTDTVKNQKYKCLQRLKKLSAVLSLQTSEIEDGRAN